MMGLCSNGNNGFKITRYENKDNYDMPFGVVLLNACLEDHTNLDYNDVMLPGYGEE